MTSLNFDLAVIGGGACWLKRCARGGNVRQGGGLG